MWNTILLSVLRITLREGHLQSAYRAPTGVYTAPTEKLAKGREAARRHYASRDAERSEAERRALKKWSREAARIWAAKRPISGREAARKAGRAKRASRFYKLDRILSLKVLIFEFLEAMTRYLLSIYTLQLRLIY